MTTIVVGFDGSAGAEAALRFGLAEAKLRGARVHVIHAWPPPPYTPGSREIAPLPRPWEDAAGRRRLALTNVRLHVELAQRRAGADEVPLEVFGLDGEPDDVLVKASREAQLLVVGTRGHGRLASLFVGSVSRACARRALCPVVIVPPEPADESRAHISQLESTATGP